MFFLVLTIIFSICMYIGIRINQEGLFATGIILSFISGFILILFVYTGIFEYPDLKGDYDKVKILTKRVSDIKNAYYKETYHNKNVLVSGSIENIKQSTYLTKAVQRLITIEAKYQSELTKCKIKKEEIIFWWFSNSFFISDKIYELPDLKIKSVL